MKAYSKLCLFLSGCLLQCLPLILQAQVRTSPFTEMPPPLPTAAAVHVPIAPLPLVPRPESPVINNDRSICVEPNASLGTDRVTEILNFWFGYLPGPDYFPVEKLPIWFSMTPEIDRQIRANFLQDVINASRGDYNDWRHTPQGRLALILLLDQIPRRIYRETVQAFMLDRMARALVLEGLQKGDDQQLYPIERAFFYLPLEHSEDLSMQNLSVSAYQQLVRQSPPNIRPEMLDFLRYAIIHQQQIARFDRFPHRNAILRRESTPEETVFLTQWRRRFF